MQWMKGQLRLDRGQGRLSPPAGRCSGASGGGRVRLLSFEDIVANLQGWGVLHAGIEVQ
jgi:hypothetical protein